LPQCIAIRCEIAELKKAEEMLREIREAERGRIARDLHNVVLQYLTWLFAVEHGRVVAQGGSWPC